MKKFLIIFSSIFLIIVLTTFNPNQFNNGLNFFKINEIEIQNLKILDKKKMANLFYDKLFGSSLLIFDEKKIDKIIDDNKLIEFIEFKKIYPSKLKIKIYEKEVIAIVNNNKSKFYLTTNGEEIKFIEISALKELPNIFGDQKNFLKIYNTLEQLNFPILKIKSFYYFDIGRWDIILKSNKVIKLPVKNFIESLKNYMELSKKIDFEKYFIFDYRLEDQLILN